MVTKRFQSPWAVAVLAELQNGEWHGYEAVLKIAADFVPPQLAREKGEYYRRYRYEREGLPCPLDVPEASIRTGSRLLVGREIRKLAYHGVIEVTYEQEPTKKRKTPVEMRMRPTEW